MTIVRLKMELLGNIVDGIANENSIRTIAHILLEEIKRIDELENKFELIETALEAFNMHREIYSTSQKKERNE